MEGQEGFSRLDLRKHAYETKNKVGQIPQGSQVPNRPPLTSQKSLTQGLIAYSVF